MLKKEVKWCWNKECQTSFEKLKDILSSETVLAHFDPSVPIKLTTDASSHGNSAILSHISPDESSGPIAYASKTFSPSERSYSQIEEEALSIIFGLRINCSMVTNLCWKQIINP